MPKKILVVDDERHIRRLLQVNLERAGYGVVTAFDGQDALEKVDSEKPDLVVLDKRMPYMDGIEALQNLRKNPATRELPVILLIAREWDENMWDWRRLFPDVTYLMKPLDPAEMISFVKRIFASQNGAELL